MSFLEVFNSIEPEKVRGEIYGTDHSAVERVIASRSKISSDLSQLRRNRVRDFATLISPAAKPYLEQLAALSHSITQRRFGRTIGMYVPLYLSNECQNICTYCGFSFNNKLPRLTLSMEEIELEARAIKALGFDHVLLVTGEAQQRVGMPYFEEALKVLRPYFSNISMEVQPLDQPEYQRLSELGVFGVLVYQETYDRAAYKTYHPKGRKSNFEYRLETPDRLGRAGMHKIGLGALIGLHDWRTDSWHVAQHLDYLERTYWRTKYAVSFPRLRPAEGLEEVGNYISDAELVQLICAYRICFEDVEVSLSTREGPRFRDNVVRLGVTTMSAGSKTEPGGYAIRSGSLEQFSTDDRRSPSEVAAAIRAVGYEPVWKDWEPSFCGVR